MKKLNVLYDISDLGNGMLYGEKFKGGIFRFSKNVLDQLVNSKDINLYLYSANGNIATCKKYIKKHKLSSKCTFLYPKNLCSNLVIANEFITSWRYKLKQKHNIFASLLRSCLSILKTSIESIISIVNKIKRPSINLKHIDVYHSPYAEIPEEIRKKKSIKCVLTIHDLTPILFPHYSKYSYQKAVNLINSIQNDDHIICISKSTKNDLLHFNPKIKNVHIIHNGISDDFYPAANHDENWSILKKYNISKNTKYILSLFCISKNKNLDLTINAFINLIKREKLTNLYLVIAGATLDDSLNSTLEIIKNNEKIQKQIIFTGFVKQKHLPMLYSEALCFVFPSLYEGFGLPPAEAMKCGCPVITSNVSSLPEVVGNAGIAIDPNNEKELEKAICKIYKDNDCRKNMIKKGFKQAEKFSWQNNINKTINIYKNDRSKFI